MPASKPESEFDPQDTHCGGRELISKVVVLHLQALACRYLQDSWGAELHLLIPSGDQVFWFVGELEIYLFK